MWRMEFFLALLSIISIRGEVLTHTTSFTPPPFLWSTCTKLGKESERSCICVMGYWICLLRFFCWNLNCSDSVVFFVSILLQNRCSSNYMWGLLFFSHVDNNSMTACFTNRSDLVQCNFYLTRHVFAFIK
jgi:hypothetical protein